MKNAKFRWWFITVNNPQSNWKAHLESYGSQYGLGQLEQGESGTPHIQAVIWFKEPIRPSFWREKQCWSKGITSDAAIERIENYCSKESTRLEGPHEFGSRPFRRNSKLDWEEARTLAKKGEFEKIPAQIHITCFQSLKKIHAENQKPNQTPDVRGVWIYGPPGVGKSHYARERYPLAYSKPQNKWFDGYKGEESIILDDLDQMGSCLGHYFKIWMDKWEAYGEVKGATVALTHHNFVITSNYLPSDLWTDQTLIEAIQRRCIFINIPRRGQVDIGTSPGALPVPEYQYDLFSWIKL